MIRNAAHRAAGIITVSQALKDAIVALGIPESDITVLRNGVDLELFHPGEREERAHGSGFRERYFCPWGI